jgi:NADH-quinone oxidoreductase subunit D
VTTTVQTPTGAAETMVLNMGPQHPSTHGVLRVLIELNGENVIKAQPDIGYLHTGIEKSCESKTYSQAITLTDRLDYLAPLSNNLCYVLAVEKLMGLEIPPRAKYTRVMLTELQRISSHLVWLGTHALDLGAMSVFLYCFREREEILKIFEMFAGQRMMTSYFRIGGIAAEPPAGWEERVGRFIEEFPSRIQEYEDLLTNNRIWHARTKGVGFIDPKMAIAVGVSGPSLRGSGVPYDVRKVFPYAGYEEFDFDMIVRPEGDVYARYLCRVAEMRESLKIVKQAMAKIPADGLIKSAAPGVVPPQREKMKTEMEALIYHFKIFTEGFSPPPGEVYQVIESPRGELGFYVCSDGTPKPWRVKVRAPSFVNLQALPKMVHGKLIADVVACIGTIDIVLGEIDR